MWSSAVSSVGTPTPDVVLQNKRRRDAMRKESAETNRRMQQTKKIIKAQTIKFGCKVQLHHNSSNSAIAVVKRRESSAKQVSPRHRLNATQAQPLPASATTSANSVQKCEALLKDAKKKEKPLQPTHSMSMSMLPPQRAQTPSTRRRLKNLESHIDIGTPGSASRSVNRSSIQKSTARRSTRPSATRPSATRYQSDRKSYSRRTAGPASKTPGPSSTDLVAIGVSASKSHDGSTTQRSYTETYSTISDMTDLCSPCPSTRRSSIASTARSSVRKPGMQLNLQGAIHRQILRQRYQSAEEAAAAGVIAATVYHAKNVSPALAQQRRQAMMRSSVCLSSDASFNAWHRNTQEFPGSTPGHSTQNS
jgi:hypothetical protein